MVAYAVNPGFPRGKADRDGSYQHPSLHVPRAARSVDSQTAHVIAPDPVSAAVKPSEDLDDSCGARPSNADERTDKLASHQPSID
jgi:hypothetical protein